MSRSATKRGRIRRSTDEIKDESAYNVLNELERQNTLIPCGACGHGVRPSYAVTGVDGMPVCHNCASVAISSLSDEITHLRRRLRSRH